MQLTRMDCLLQRYCVHFLPIDLFRSCWIWMKSSLMRKNMMDLQTKTHLPHQWALTNMIILNFKKNADQSLGRGLSRLEQRMLENAKQRQKENIVKTQVVMHREFKVWLPFLIRIVWFNSGQGESFISKPEKVEFLDFEVGSVHKQTILLTNVSLSFNSFKFLPLSPKIRDFFKIKYNFPGRMSAGTSCPVKGTSRFTILIHLD